MAITVEARTEIISLVVGMFGAAPGASVLSDLTAAYEAGATVSQIAANLANTAEFKSIYPTFLTNGEYATKIVNNLLAEADAAAKAEAVTVLTAELNGGMTRTAAMVAAINFVANSAASNTAYASSATAFDNKVDVAIYYSVEKQLSGSSLDELQGWILDVTSSADTVTKAKAEADGDSTEGKNFTLTTGIDNLTGTSGNDTFIGDNTTASAADQVVGGAGSDTLKLYGNATAPAYSGIETVYLQGNTAGFDVSSKSDVTELQLVDATTAQTYTIANGQKASAATMLDGEVIDFAGNTVTALALTVNGLGTATGAGVTVDLNSTAQTALTLTSATTASNIVLRNTGAKLATLNIAGDKAITVDADANNTILTTIDASASTGGVNVIIEDDTAVKDVTATGGTGNDTFNFGATFTKGDKVNGGDGTDTLAITQASLTVVNAYVAADKTVVNDNLSNIEVLKITDALTSNIDASRFDSVNSIVLAAGNNAGGTATISNVTSGVTVEIGDAAGAATNVTAIEITDATLAGNNSDAVTLKLSDKAGAGSSDAGVVNLVGVDLLTIDTTQATGGTTTDHVIDIAATSSALDKVTVVGNTALNISTVALVNSIAEVDASGMTLAATTSNGLTVAIATGGTNGVKITGSTGVDVLTGGDAADIIIAGTGNDSVVGGKGNDVLTGGAGNDTFKFAAADSGITSTSFDSITDYSNGTVAGTTDTIDFTTSNGVVGTTALAGFTLNNGVASKSGATVADFIAAVQAAGTANETYAFVSGSDTYVYNAGANGTTNTTDDTLIKLVGVVGVSVVTTDTTVANEIMIA